MSISRSQSTFAFNAQHPHLRHSPSPDAVGGASQRHDDVPLFVDTASPRARLKRMAAAPFGGATPRRAILSAPWRED